MKIELTRLEIRAALWAVGNHTESNANDVSVMMDEGMSRSEAKALIRVNEKLRKAGGYKMPRKAGENAP